MIIRGGFVHGIVHNIAGGICRQLPLVAKFPVVKINPHSPVNPDHFGITALLLSTRVFPLLSLYKPTGKLTSPAS